MPENLGQGASPRFAEFGNGNVKLSGNTDLLIAVGPPKLHAGNTQFTGAYLQSRTIGGGHNRAEADSENSATNGSS